MQYRAVYIYDTCSKTTFKKIKNLIKLAKAITRHDIAYLLEFDFKSSNFYGLPKIHKSCLIKGKCGETQSGLLDCRPKAALLFWFFGDFRCGALLFMVIHVIYKYKNK